MADGIKDTCGTNPRTGVRFPKEMAVGEVSPKMWLSSDLHNKCPMGVHGHECVSHSCTQIIVSNKGN